MSGSTFGTVFTITTWGESHGKALGVVIDGCPSGIPLEISDIQQELDRRKPGSNPFATQRKESDTVQLLSGVFDGKTTGTPISLLVFNEDHHSSDYSQIADVYRPGHADFTFQQKYGFRDYRGGGRTSGRETIGRVAAGAIAKKILISLGIEIIAYTKSIGPITIDQSNFQKDEISNNPVGMPDSNAAKKAADYLKDCMEKEDSAGGVIECKVEHLPTGLGEPVFCKLDALLGQAMFSIGAVKGLEFGDGFLSATQNGSTHNDGFSTDVAGKIQKRTNHAGGVLGGISDGSTLLFRVAVKPTPSIHKTQETVDIDGKPVSININGRHDPIIVPRAIVVVEAMTAITLCNLLFQNMYSKMENIENFYQSY